MSGLFSPSQIFNNVFSSAQNALRVIGGAKFAPPPDFDNFELDPQATADVYTFYAGATLLRTITINYTDASKETILDGSVVDP